MKEVFNPLESPTTKPTMSIKFSDGTQEQVSIIIVHHNRPEFLSMCLQSIYVMSNLSNYEIIVVDNNSDQESQDFLDELIDKGIKVVKNSENLYWSAAANKGVKLADPHSKYFLFLHADTIVLDPAWIDVLVNLSIAQKSGMVGVKQGSYWVSGQLVTFLEEWCLLMTRHCWEDCGPWPEELPLVGMSFIMTYKAQKKGYNPKTIGNTIAHHFKMFSADPNEYERMAEDARSEMGMLMMKINKS